MNPHMARLEIAELRKLSNQQADERLCRMHSECWHAIAAELGIKLPLYGGDKPAIIIGQLRLKGGKA